MADGPCCPARAALTSRDVPAPFPSPVYASCTFITLSFSRNWGMEFCVAIEFA